MSWAPPYTTTSDLAGYLGVNDSPGLALPIEAASRAIDQATGRQFGSATQTRTYRPRWARNCWYVNTDDIVTLSAVENHDGTEITDYVLTPRNAVPNGKPYTGIEFHSAPFGWYAGYPVNHHHSVITLTGVFGWPEIPDAITLATQIQAARLYARRDSISGPLSSEKVDDVAYGYGSLTELDSDVLTVVAPYRRHWVAV